VVGHVETSKTLNEPV